VVAALKRLRERLRPPANPREAQDPPSLESPPSTGFLGEHIYYRDPRNHPVRVRCVDVSTDWVPLFEAEVFDGAHRIEHHQGLRGYTALTALAESRQWTKRLQGSFSPPIGAEGAERE
jgi:hypothetical protein